MSRDDQAAAPISESTGQSSGTRRVGTRDFNRRAQAVRGRVKRKRRKTTESGFFPKTVGALKQIPRAAWICALVAFLSAACWSVLTPPFEIPDEPDHFAYTQQLAENHQLPTSGRSTPSPEEMVVLRDLHQYEVHLTPEFPSISTAAEQELLQEDLALHPSRVGGGGVGGAYADPPLYYLVETIPYALASGGTLLDQLELMRLLGALMGGLTALFVFLFIRETLPGTRWAWTVGGLGVALAPLLGYMSGAVNPDAMLTTVSAAIFYCFAYAFRHGFTRRLALTIGTLTAVGILTKINFVGLFPGIIFGMIVLTVPASRVYGRATAYRSLGFALIIATAPAWLYLLANLLSNHPALGIVSTTLKLGGAHGSIFGKISYVWEFYLPRLPGMVNHFPGLSTTRRLWFDRSVGFYGWVDTTFPVWVDNLALVPAGILALLFLRAIVLGRAALRRRLPELLVYGAIGVGLMVLVGLSSYIDGLNEGLFGEPRYFLPLLPLVGVALALTARGAGRRWGPTVGALIVVLFLAHNIFSQLLVVARYYV